MKKRSGEVMRKLAGLVVLKDYSLGAYHEVIQHDGTTVLIDGSKEFVKKMAEKCRIKEEVTQE